MGKKGSSAWNYGKSMTDVPRRRRSVAKKLNVRSANSEGRLKRVVDKVAGE
jgi:hypothetical protein